MIDRIKLQQWYFRMAGAATAPPGVVALSVVCASSLIALRNPARLWHPQFYAEDGYVFFQSAWEHGFLSSLVETYSGYLHIVPRVVAGCALLVPLLYAPLVFNLSALLIMLIPVLYLLSNRTRSLPSFSARVVCAALFVSMPASQETYVNITNAHWYLMFAACFMFAAEPPVNKRQLAADTLVLGAFALSSPLSVVFIPVAVARVWRDRRRAGLAQPWLAPTTLGLGVTLQAIASLPHPRVMKGFAATYGAFPLVKEFVMYGFYNATLGIWGNYQHFASFGTAAYLLGLTALMFLALVSFKRRSHLGLLLLYTAIAVFTLEHVFPARPGSRRDEPGYNVRYHVFSVWFVLFAARQAAVGSGYMRYIGGAVLASALLVGIPGDYFFHNIPDTHYADQVAVFRALDAGTSFSFPVAPVIAAPMVLSRKGEKQTLSLLEGRSIIPEPAIASLGVSLNSQKSGTATTVTVKGTAYDKHALKPPGSVLIAVDNRLFPATTFDLGYVTGFEFMLARPEYRRIGFMRNIPVSEIGRGRHDISLIIMTHDRRSCYQPTGLKTITVP